MDLDALLEDSEPTGSVKAGNKSSWNTIAKTKLPADDDDLDDDELFNWGAKKKATAPKKSPVSKPAADDDWGDLPPSTNNKIATQMSFAAPGNTSFHGSQGSRGKNVEDEFDAMLNDIDGGTKPVAPKVTKQTSHGAFLNASAKKDEDDGWGVPTTEVRSQYSGGFAKNSYGVKSQKDDDDLDDILGDLEAKKGIEKPKVEARPKTAAPTWGQVARAKQGDDLDDLDDAFGGGAVSR